VTTDLGYLREVVRSEAFLSSQVDTMYLESFQPSAPLDLKILEKETAVAATLFIHKMRKKKIQQGIQSANRWQGIAWREQMVGNF